MVYLALDSRELEAARGDAATPRSSTRPSCGPATRACSGPHQARRGPLERRSTTRPRACGRSSSSRTRFAYYSLFLALLYAELDEAGEVALLARASTTLHRKLMRSGRGRRSSWPDLRGRREDSTTRYRDNLLALISDVRFPAKGEARSAGGLRLRRAHPNSDDPDPPDPPAVGRGWNAARAEARMRTSSTRAPASSLTELKRFMEDNLGFGDFVFRLPDGTEVARAADLALAGGATDRGPERVHRFHAARNHFSIGSWPGREFGLAVAHQTTTV